MLSVLVSIIVFVIIIGIAISVHEVGHFIAAKLSGIRVEEFALGFGLKIFSKKYKGTNYVLKIFPIGGSISILGEEEKIKKKDSFSEKPYLVKIFVIVGGIIMNFFLSVMVFYVLLAHQNYIYSSLPYYDDFQLPFGEQTKAYAYPPFVLKVVEGGNAEKAGIKQYYELVEVNGEDVESAEELKSVLEDNVLEIVEIGYVDEDGKEGNADVLVGEDGKIGIAHAEDIPLLQVEYVGVQKYFSGFLHTVNMIEANFFLIGKVFQQAIEQKDIGPVSEAVSGPVGLLAITDTVREYAGFWGIFELLGVLSIALLVTNIIPIPGLDGSHVLFITIETIIGKPINENIKKVIFGAGMILLFSLAFVVAIKDVFQFGIWDWVKELFS
ncbi:MAG: M50 family metallopeptidase [bacterium]